MQGFPSNIGLYGNDLVHWNEAWFNQFTQPTRGFFCSSFYGSLLNKNHMLICLQLFKGRIKLGNLRFKGSPK